MWNENQFDTEPHPDVPNAPDLTFILRQIYNSYQRLGRNLAHTFTSTYTQSYYVLTGPQKASRNKAIKCITHSPGQPHWQTQFNQLNFKYSGTLNTQHFKKPRYINRL